MLSAMKAGASLAAALTGAAILCPPLDGEAGTATANQSTGIQQAAADTSRVRMHISGMTCGSCPTTARLALTKLEGVYSAKVTIDDSLGVVHYDPRRVTPAKMTSHLKRLTGFVATVLPDSTTTPRNAGGA